MAQKIPNTLPPMQTLFSDSWKAFKKSVLNLFILYLVVFGLGAGIGIAGIILSLPLGILAFFSGVQDGKLTPAVISSLGALGILLFIVVIIFIVLCYAAHAASTLFIGGYASKPAFGKTFKKSFRYVLPLMLVGFLSGLITAGGYFLFIIPGFFFSFLFSFAAYEVILNNQGAVSAMKRSARIVLTHFWGVLARIILWVIIVMVISFIPGLLAGNSTSAQASVSGLSFFVNILMGWYGICYSITLYKQASKGLEADKGISLLWPVILSIVGWVVGIVLIIALFSVIILAAGNLVQKNKDLKKYQINQGQQLPGYAPWKSGTSSAK